MSRPTKLEVDVQRRLEEAFQIGQISIATACAYAGIAERTYHNWMAAGRKGQEPYVQFLQAMEKARADAVMVNLAVIRRAAQSGHWQAAAWWLERTHPQDFGRKTAVTVLPMDTVDAEIARLEAELALNDVEA